MIHNNEPYLSGDLVLICRHTHTDSPASPYTSSDCQDNSVPYPVGRSGVGRWLRSLSWLIILKRRTYSLH